MNSLRIATRKSPLALWQAKHVASQLQALHPAISIELLKLSTRGDKILDSPLNKVGGKGLFVKELEQALIRNEADIAVHSMKDVPMELPESLRLDVILAREDPRDAFVSNRYLTPDELPPAAVVGTSSLRRQAQLQARYPELKILPLRGNVGTRLQKLDEGKYDAIILAAAGLKRLRFENRIASILDSNDSLPAAGQGAIGIECRNSDSRVISVIEPLHDGDTAACVAAERALNRRLNGGCQVPIAAYGVLENDVLHLRGLVADPNGSEVIRGEVRGPRDEVIALGRKLADDFLQRGAGAILARCGVVV